MITAISKKMMRRSFENTRYKFAAIPSRKISGKFLAYVHVPFCHTKCNFCPFYKELYSEESKNKYVDAVVKEIEGTEMEGEASSVYFGGGTPNTLLVNDLKRIVGAIGKKVKLGEIGMEAMPNLLDRGYLEGLKKIGFRKISMGVESLSDEVIGKSGRQKAGYEKIREVVAIAKSVGLWVNVDMMIGLPGQSASGFRSDIGRIAEILPDQITIYPFMKLKNVAAEPGLPSMEQFAIIEEAAESLKKYGYARKNVWTMALGGDVCGIYDTSGEELDMEYVGFGAGAFSSHDGWSIVNPELRVYLENVENEKKMGFVAKKSKMSSDWRRFASMIYNLRCQKSERFPAAINAYIGLLGIAGHAEKGRLTGKGKIFSHEITKSVVESLPFPLQNGGCVENYDEYALCKTKTAVK